MDMQQGNETKSVETAHRLVIEGVGIIAVNSRGGYVGTTQDGRVTDACDSLDTAAKALRDLAARKMSPLNKEELHWLVDGHSRGLVCAAWSDTCGRQEQTFEHHANRLRELRDYWGKNLLGQCFDPDNRWDVVGRCGRWVISYDCDLDSGTSYGPWISYSFEDGLPTTWILAEKEVLRRVLTHADWKSVAPPVTGYNSPSPFEAGAWLDEINKPTEGKTTE
jgi:hypothetical protein